MQIEYDIEVVNLTAKPYEFNGQSGISYKAKVLSDSDVLEVKTTEAVYETLKGQGRVKGTGSFVIKSGGYGVSVLLNSFQAE